MSINTTTLNPTVPARLLSKTSGNTSYVGNSQDLSAKNNTPQVPATAVKSLLPAYVVRDLLKPMRSTSDDAAKLNKLLESGQITEFREKLQIINAKSAMTMLAVEQKKALLTGVAERLPLSVSAAEASTRLLAADDAPDTTLLSIFTDVVNKSESSTSSSKEICDAVADAIASMGENYLDIFQEAVEVFASFYADFSEAIASLKKYIKADKDKIVFDGRGFAAELRSVINKYSGDAGILYSASSVEEARAWAKEMGLDPDKCVDGTNVRIDLSSIQKLADDTYKNNNVTLNSAQWAAYQSSVDIVKDSVQTSMQSLTQKYSNANSTFDNLVRILSGTISQLLESDKSFFNI